MPAGSERAAPRKWDQPAILSGPIDRRKSAVSLSRPLAAALADAALRPNSGETEPTQRPANNAVIHRHWH